MLDRRSFMKTCSGMGLAGTLFPGVLWAQAAAQGSTKITKEMIANAAVIAGVNIPGEYREMMLDNLNDQAKGYQDIYDLHIPNSVDPALIFDPVLPGLTFPTERKPMHISEAPHIATQRSRRIWTIWLLPVCANGRNCCARKKFPRWPSRRCIWRA
jgi:hypothetical protein